jgi:hypothetical protein
VRCGSTAGAGTTWRSPVAIPCSSAVIDAELVFPAENGAPDSLGLQAAIGRRTATVSWDLRGMAGSFAPLGTPLDAGVPLGAPPVHPILTSRQVPRCDAAFPSAQRARTDILLASTSEVIE